MTETPSTYFKFLKEIFLTLFRVSNPAGSYPYGVLFFFYGPHIYELINHQKFENEIKDKECSN